MPSPFPITAPQSEGFVAKHFQAKIIQGVCEALATRPRAPCLLRSPTGSGKTFVLTAVWVKWWTLTTCCGSNIGCVTRYLLRNAENSNK